MLSLYLNILITDLSFLRLFNRYPLCLVYCAKIWFFLSEILLTMVYEETKPR